MGSATTKPQCKQASWCFRVCTGENNVRFLPPAHCEVPVVISHEGDVPVLCFRACLITRNILHESLPDKEYKTVKSTICAEKCMSVYMCTDISAQQLSYCLHHSVKPRNTSATQVNCCGVWGFGVCLGFFSNLQVLKCRQNVKSLFQYDFTMSALAQFCK